jgi:hypothetical protein
MGPHSSPREAVGGDATGETLLALAVVRQAKKDLTSPRKAVRADAAPFWGDGQAVAFWSDLLDCDVTHLQRAVQRAAP